MVFIAWQQEKCQYQNADRYMAIVDLTKAFDCQPGGPMEHHGQVCVFIDIVRKLHDGMMASIRDQQELSDPIPITNGVKQGCILAPMLFTMVFSVMLQDSYQNNTGISFIYHCDGGLFNQRMQVKTKVEEVTVQELLFADDSALAASSNEELQVSMDNFFLSLQQLQLNNQHRED